MDETTTTDPSVVCTDEQTLSDVAKSAADTLWELLRLLPAPIPTESRVYASLEAIRSIPLQAKANPSVGVQVDFINQEPKYTIEETMNHKPSSQQQNPEKISNKENMPLKRKINDSILVSVKPKNYKTEQQQKVTIYANEEDVIECLNIASKAMSEHKYDKAKRMAEKAERIYPTSAARALLEQISIVTEAKERTVAKTIPKSDKTEIATKTAGQTKKEDLKTVFETHHKSIAATFEDPMRSEATFRFTVTVHDLDSFEEMLSPPCLVRGLSWRIIVEPSSKTRQYLDVFLHCDGVSAFPDWSCDVEAELRLISHALNQPLYRRFEHTFSSDETDWGVFDFIPWADMMNPGAGYVKDGAVTMEVYMKAEPPLGIP